jgi:hypothetical protein
MASTVLAFFVAAFWVWLQKKLDAAFELPENRQRLRAIKGLWKAKQNTA